MGTEPTLVHVATIDGYHHRIEVRGLDVESDLPRAKGGTDHGPTSIELALGALGACMAQTMLMYARRKGWPLEGVEVDVRHTGEHIEKLLQLKGDLDSDQTDRLREIASRCPVHRLIAHEQRIVDADGGAARP